MSSYDYGKTEIVEYIHKHFKPGSTCLDVGACDGKWFYLVGDYLKMDAVEIFEPNVTANNLQDIYKGVYVCDIADYKYKWYDLIIFGDVIEHMEVDKAQKVLEYAKQHCKDLIIGVPFLYKQGALYGNEYERHIQSDLTAELFEERYGKYDVLYQVDGVYCYYHAPVERKYGYSQ